MLQWLKKFQLISKVPAHDIFRNILNFLFGLAFSIRSKYFFGWNEHEKKLGIFFTNIMVKRIKGLSAWNGMCNIGFQKQTIQQCVNNLCLDFEILCVYDDFEVCQRKSYTFLFQRVAKKAQSKRERKTSKLIHKMLCERVNCQIYFQTDLSDSNSLNSIQKLK